MNSCMKCKRNSGFTLLEVLVTLGIIIILLGLATVGVVRYVDSLKIAELDNAARDIYMAMENRAVLLSGGQRLEDLVPDPSPLAAAAGTAVNHTELVGLSALAPHSDEEELYYLCSVGLDKELLTTGGIDETLLDNGEFYVVYDLNSGSVTDVFYAEKDTVVDTPLQDLVDENGGGAIEGGKRFAAFYEIWAATRSVRLGLKNPPAGSGAFNSNKTLVGWYNGEAAQNGAFGKDISVKPYLDVMIDNREKLTVTVTVRGAYVDYISAPGVLSVWLSSALLDGEPNSTNSIDLMNIAHQNGGSDNDASYTWVLDSLTGNAADPDNGPIHFKALSDGNHRADYFITPGEDFMVTAIIDIDAISGADNLEAPDPAWDVNNSLYQEGSDNGQGVAYIRYLRHLQNLDAKNGFDSGVQDNITSALQTANIQVHNNDTYPEYNFVPIYNANITAYDGNEREIQNLNVDLTDGTGNRAPNEGLIVNQNSLGLFRETRPEGMEFRGIRLVNAKVKGSGASAGALVGETSGTTVIDNCWVYWDTDGYVTSLKAALGTDETAYNYQIEGVNAGGLVGKANNTTTIAGSLAATLVRGTSAAGGLVGEWNVSGRAEGYEHDIYNSYADCYLTSNTKAAGLIGNATTDVSLQYCYSAGFILGVKANGGLHAAGVSLGTGRATLGHVYTVMLYMEWLQSGKSGKWIDVDFNDIEDTGKGYNVSYLTESLPKIENGDTTVHYLGYGEDHDQVDESEILIRRHSHYSEMTNRVASAESPNYADVMNGDDADGKFTWKGSTNSNPYNLREELSLSVYSYPGLKDLPHYGDWGAEFEAPSLVYYELYDTTGDGKGDTWGISGGNARNLYSLRDNATIVSDGYAVAFLTDEVDSGVNSVSIKYTYFDADGNEKSLSSGTITVPTSAKTKWGDHEAYLIPLPDELVYGDDARECFYQYLQFELYLGSGENGHVHASGEFFFNPHFAETVISYIGENKEDGTPKTFFDDHPRTPEAIADYANGLVRKMEHVKIRTPRQLYDLSQFGAYYNQSRYTFYQELNLDYATYDWRRMIDKANKIILENPPAIDGNGKLVGVKLDTEHGETDAYYNQKPIGKFEDNDYFYGTYDGGSHVIKNVLPKVDRDTLSQKNPYVGLFGFSAGTLQNVVYEMETHTLTVEVGSSAASGGDTAGERYVGSLVGGNLGSINNCAVYGVKTDVDAPGVQIYVGGLVGLNRWSTTNSAAECAELFAKSYSSGHIYLGGFAGRNISTIDTSYAVGHIKIDAAQGGNADVCGFAGSAQTGSITNSYAATYLDASGEGVTRHSFADDGGNMDKSNLFLDQGSFLYREEEYGANYSEEPGSTTYNGLTGKFNLETEQHEVADASLVVPGMDWVTAVVDEHPEWAAGAEEPFFPYPTAVKDVTDPEHPAIHYGRWPGALPMGAFGVLYWEEMASGLDENGNPVNPAYYFDALTVNLNTDGTINSITERNTLVTNHDDGKVVTAYGYGYYYDSKDGDGLPKDFFTANRLGYFVYSADELTTSSGTRQITSTAIPTTYSGVEPGGEPYTGGELLNSRTKKITALTDGRADENQNNSNYQGAPHSGYKKTSGTADGTVFGSNLALADVIPGSFTVVSWDSYHEGGGLPNGWTGDEEDEETERLKNSTAGLVPWVVWEQSGKTWSLPAASSSNNIWDPNSGYYGTFTLQNGSVSVEFIIDPHFAGALSVSKIDGAAVNANDPRFNGNGSKLTGKPGSKNNPFQVRCGTQLQEINASTRLYTDFCIGMGGPAATYENKYWDFPTAAMFPYLSSVNISTSGNIGTIGTVDTSANNRHKFYRYYYFKQTHDINWTAEGNTYDGKAGVFTPIAAAAARMAQNVWNIVDMPGWFAGSYDGGNYVLRNFNIDINSEKYNTSCIGLFGAIYNNYDATGYDSVKAPEKTALTNIVLYSETGESSTVYVRGREAGSSLDAWGNSGMFTVAGRWYAGGVLVGAAVGGCEISNCAVAGYTIIDQTRTGADNINYNSTGGSTTLQVTYHYGPGGEQVSRSTSYVSGLGNIQDRASTGVYSGFFNSNSELIAGAVGGLVGLTDGGLSGCAAVTTMILKPNHSEINHTNAPVAVRQIQDLTGLSNTRNSVFYRSCGEGSTVRAGGLAGSVKGTVKNCYTGGEIQLKTVKLTKDANGATTGFTDTDGATNCALNIGRIVGGVGSGVFANKDAGSSANIENCYTYMKLPDDEGFQFNYAHDAFQYVGPRQGDYTRMGQGTPASPFYYVWAGDNQGDSIVTAFRTGYVTSDYYATVSSGTYQRVPEFKLVNYAIGGVGAGGARGDANAKGTLSIINCFYIPRGGFANDSRFSDGIDRDDESTTLGDVVNYQQLSGTGAVTGTEAATSRDGTGREVVTKNTTNYEDITKALNNGKTGDIYDWVTKTVGESNLDVPGRFSYVPQIAAYDHLQDTNYPFPTVLTRDHYGVTVNVHYGGWPEHGVWRETGGTPITLDMFVPDGHDDCIEPAFHTETLGVRDVTGGTWSVANEEDIKEFVDVKFLPENSDTTTMTMTAVSNIEIPVTVTMTIMYSVNGEDCTLDVPVNIAANVALDKRTVSVFENDTVNMRLKPLTSGSDPIGDYVLAITDTSVVGGQLGWEQRETTDTGTLFRLTRGAATSSDPQAVWADVTYDYTQYYGNTPQYDEDGTRINGHTEYNKTHRIEVTYLKQPEPGVWTRTENGQWVWTFDFNKADDERPENWIIPEDTITNPQATVDGVAWEHVQRVAVSNGVLTVTMRPEVKFIRDITLYVTLTMSDGLDHEMSIAIPKPVTGDDLEALLNVEEKEFPTEPDPNDPDPTEPSTIPGKIWTIDLRRLEPETFDTFDIKVKEALGDAVTVDFDYDYAYNYDNEGDVLTAIRITWNGTGEEPKTITLTVSAKKGNLVQEDCVLTVSLSPEEVIPDDSETAAMPPENEVQVVDDPDEEDLDKKDDEEFDGEEDDGDEGEDGEDEEGDADGDEAPDAEP